MLFVVKFILSYYTGVQAEFNEPTACSDRGTALHSMSYVVGIDTALC
jgi:hypothetical protein